MLLLHLYDAKKRWFIKDTLFCCINNHIVAKVTVWCHKKDIIYITSLFLSQSLTLSWYFLHISIIRVTVRITLTWILTLGLKLFNGRGCYLGVLKPRTTPEGWTTRGSQLTFYFVLFKSKKLILWKRIYSLPWWVVQLH